MAYATFTSTWVPTYGASLKRKARLHVAQFGDGYKQVSPDGINYNPQVWNLKWDVSPTVAAAIAAFLASHDAVPFKWTTPEGVLIFVTCEEFDHTWDTFGNHTVTAQFTQDFAAEV